jgi:hypothetical protein
MMKFGNISLSDEVISFHYDFNSKFCKKGFRALSYYLSNFNNEQVVMQKNCNKLVSLQYGFIRPQYMINL